MTWNGKVTEGTDYSVSFDSPNAWIRFEDPETAIKVGEALAKVGRDALARKARDGLGKLP